MSQKSKIVKDLTADSPDEAAEYSPDRKIDNENEASRDHHGSTRRRRISATYDTFQSTASSLSNIHASMKKERDPNNRAVLSIHRKIETVRRTVDENVCRLLISVKIHAGNPSISSPSGKTVRIHIVPIPMAFVNSTAVVIPWILIPPKLGVLQKYE